MTVHSLAALLCHVSVGFLWE